MEQQRVSTWKWIRKNILLSAVMTVLYIVCFPVNPLALTGVLETDFYLSLFIIGWIVWAFGMALVVVAPFVMFPRRGGVPKGKSFMNTTRLVDTGVYAVVRHPQYLGGTLSIFVTTLLWYPHWLFGVLGAAGTVIMYLSIIEEEQHLVQRFGDDYVRYMKRVPRMNLVLGVMRVIRRKQT